MPLSENTTVENKTTTQPIDTSSNVANFAKISSGFIGGIGGGIAGTIGSILGTYSSTIASAAAFGCAGAAIGASGGIVICAGVIQGVVWFNSRKLNTAQEDELKQTSEEMMAQLQQPINFANNVLHQIHNNIGAIQVLEIEQITRMDDDLEQFNASIPSLNHATTQMIALVQPLQIAATNTEDQVNSLIETVHHLRAEFEMKTCSLQNTEKKLSEKENQLQDTLDALASNQEQFTQLLNQQQHYINNASDIFEKNTSHEAEIASLKTQIAQLSSKNREFVTTMNNLLAEINALKIENKTLKQTIMRLSLALEEKAPQELHSQPSYSPTLFRHNA